MLHSKIHTQHSALTARCESHYSTPEVAILAAHNTHPLVSHHLHIHVGHAARQVLKLRKPPIGWLLHKAQLHICVMEIHIQISCTLVTKGSA